MTVRLRVPASSANLGPGFDALGLALNLHLTCDLAIAADLAISATGLDADAIPRDESNLIWCTAMTVAAHQNRQLPVVNLTIHNEIPLGKGLGSSAAALTSRRRHCRSSFATQLVPRPSAERGRQDRRSS